MKIPANGKKTRKVEIRDRNIVHLVVVPTTKKDISSVAMDFHKQTRKRDTEAAKHERMIRLPAALCKIAKKRIDRRRAFEAAREAALQAGPLTPFEQMMRQMAPGGRFT